MKAYLILITLLYLLPLAQMQPYRMSIPAAEKFYVGDFDGTGRKDLLRIAKDASDGRRYGIAQIYLATDTQGDFDYIYVPENFYLLPDQTNLYIGDFDGDGKDDILRQEKAEYDNDRLYTADILFSNGDGSFTYFALPEEFEMSGDLTNLYIGDFDGDGRDDILRQAKEEGDAVVYLSASVFGEGIFSHFNLPYGFTMAAIDTNLYIGDFNGDGYDDILRQEKGPQSYNLNMTAAILLSNGDGTFNYSSLPEGFEMNGDLTNLLIGDFNRDGRSDILRQEKGQWEDGRVHRANVFFSNEYGTFNKSDLPEDFLMDGDFTNLYIYSFGEGAVDGFLRQKKGSWIDYGDTLNFIYPTSDGSFVKWTTAENLQMAGDLVNIYLGDLNGDGYDDIIRHKKEDGNYDYNNFVRVLYSNGENGFGGFTDMGISELAYLK